MRPNAETHVGVRSSLAVAIVILFVGHACHGAQAIDAPNPVQAIGFTISIAQPVLPNGPVAGLTVPSGHSFTTNAQENSINLSATIVPAGLHQANAANIQWLVDSNPAGAGNSGIPPVPAAGANTTLSVSGLGIPAAPNGRGFPLSYRIRSTVQIQGGTAIDTTTIAQDITDQDRQEYIDMGKATLPARATFSSMGQSAGGHFTFVELNSGDYTVAIITDSLYNGLEAIRATMGQPITVTSGYRNPRHNAQAGGAAESQHIYGTAADLHVADFNGDGVINQTDWTLLANAACAAGAGFIESFAQDNSHVHADWGPVRAGGYVCP